jgi:hypothetical protein
MMWFLSYTVINTILAHLDTKKMIKTNNYTLPTPKDLQPTHHPRGTGLVDLRWLGVLGASP